MGNENYINHVVLVLDASTSMLPHARELVKVADGQIAYLARRSKELDQETRVSVYTFANTVQCLVYDKDVLRLPSIASLYRPNGLTALVDATMKSLDDLAHTPELYGDHAFLAFVLTDGQENASRAHGPAALATKLRSLPPNWTVAALVPDQLSVFEAKAFGFPPDNIAVWNASTAAGVAEAGETIRRATESFMTARSSGVRGSRSLFSTSIDAVNSETVSSLRPLGHGSYEFLPVAAAGPIRDRVVASGQQYRTGRAFYQLTKAETIQPQKQVAIRDKATGRVYLDRTARDLIGLPSAAVRVKPDYNPDFDIFVQSTSTNRKLVPNTELLLLR